MVNNREEILKVKDLHVSFSGYGGQIHAVRGVDFTLNKGETIAIVGESGSGKSVSVKTIMGILAKNGTIDKGEIIYEGKDLTKYTEEEFHKLRGKKIGLIFQDPLSALNPIMKIGKQITEVLTVQGKMSKADAKEKALELMNAVGIPNAEARFNQYPFQFSGGMRQRIVIAIALAGDPDVLICDEPTTALDVTVQARILELINDIKKERGLSVIFITHDLGVVANIADRVYVMYGGQVVEYGEVEEIFFEPAHPYTWALLTSMPDLEIKEKLRSIPGTPPNMVNPPKGDAFAARNEFAMEIDFVQPPPFFKITDTHYAATWLLHEDAPKINMPEVLQSRIDRMLEGEEKNE